MNLTEQTLESKLVYQGLIVNVKMDRALLPNGHEAGREVVCHPGGVAVLPLNDDGTVTMVRQYRYPFSQILSEIPAGKLEPGEDPRESALRELSEEVGAQPGELVDLGCIYSSPGFSQEVLHLYLAQKLQYGESHPDQDEFLELERIPFQTLLDEIMANNIRDGKTVACALKAKQYLGL